MSNKSLKKLQEQQEKVSSAVKNINSYFQDVACYSTVIETAAIAQQQIIMLMNIATHPASGDTSDIPDMDSVSDFIWQTMEIYKLIKPFAEMQGQINGYDD